MPTLRKCGPCQAVLAATHRHKTRKLEIMLPSMSFYFGGANDRNLQDVSVSLVLGQECWDWPAGALAQAKARDHDRIGAKAVFCGQGGWEGSEWEGEVALSEVREFAFKCPKCKEESKWIGRDRDPRDEFRAVMSWDEDEAAAPVPDWARIYKSVRFVAPCCGHRFRDLASNRRRLAMSGRYLAGKPGVPGWIAYTCSALSIPWVPWAKLAREYIAADRAEVAGDDSKMLAFVMKRLARFYSPSGLSPEFDTDASPYSRLDYWPPTGGRAPLWEDEAHRLGYADWQKSHFWLVIRAYKIGGDSRLLWEGRVEDLEQVRSLQKRFEVPNINFAVDGRYDIEAVAAARARFVDPPGQEGGPGTYWYIFMGDAGAGYLTAMPGRKNKAIMPFSRMKGGKTGSGIRYRFMKFSNLLMKNTLARLMGADDTYFGVFTDHSEDYGKQMKSEFRNPEKGNIWVPIRQKAPNHLWDCEVGIVALACVKGLLRVILEDESQGPA